MLDNSELTFLNYRCSVEVRCLNADRRCSWNVKLHVVPADALTDAFDNNCFGQNVQNLNKAILHVSSFCRRFLYAMINKQDLRWVLFVLVGCNIDITTFLGYFFVYKSRRRMLPPSPLSRCVFCSFFCIQV